MKFYFFIICNFIILLISAQDFDPTNPDYELLKKTVIEKINIKRHQKSKVELINNTSLQLTSDYYIQMLRANKFENSSANKLRLNRKIKKFCKMNGYKNAFLDFHITNISCVNFKGREFYFDKDDTETSTHLFIGKKPTKKEKSDEKFKEMPIKPYSYDELADIISRIFISDEGYFKLLNNGFDKFGFSLFVEKGSLYRHKIPNIKIILILGGNRITW